MGGRWRQAKLFGYDSEQNLCEVSEIIAASGVPLSVSEAYRQVRVAKMVPIVSSSAAMCAMSMTSAAG
ncbi:hypothetical protein AU512_16440 [Lonsdalea iberica]|uniref:Uncharacterized protein n=2 Tax=Lonsdalea TaxID=1082702 RepID=A0AAD0SET8_9GAMM|nr:MULTISPECIES: hypothetical protein [Lonsdalea]AXW86064.1 hypothetical protein CKQ53_03095 [Lonsdalea britannica]OSM97850.1 hypothetical protein AU509_07415 [Lonsdalea britannica]OSN04100.1 hypothetical protein AU512_16440 [Lonsdalea iberica]